MLAVGLKIDVNYEKETIVVHNSFPECEIKQVRASLIKAGDGGTTIDFLFRYFHLEVILTI